MFPSCSIWEMDSLQCHGDSKRRREQILELRWGKKNNSLKPSQQMLAENSAVSRVTVSTQV